MFDFIRGTVAKIAKDYVVVDVNGIGYKIFTSLTSIGSVAEGDEAKFYTSMCVSQDDVRIFGYTTDDERSLYELLITVSGVGPKVANAILSQISTRDLALAIAGGNVKAIEKAKGVGNKVASKIVLELKDKITGVSVSSDVVSNVTPSKSFFGTDSEYDDAVEALCSLGYNEQKARSLVSDVYKEGLKAQDIIKLALNQKKG